MLGQKGLEQLQYLFVRGCKYYRWFISFTDKATNTNLTTAANTSAILKDSVVNFTCTSKGNPPPREYKFYHKGIYLGNSCSGFFQIQVSEGGLYSCVPVNEVGDGEEGVVDINLVGKCEGICYYLLFLFLFQCYMHTRCIAKESEMSE